ncbi:MAG: ABC transporter ATP-binding protein [Syntrophorhabdales bacterium]
MVFRTLWGGGIRDRALAAVRKLEILQIRGLTMFFGGLAAVSEFDLNVSGGEILGLIGPNGAGKTTVLNMIAGTLIPRAGRIALEGKDITRWPAYKRVRKGIARVFQRNALFQDMTVLENVLAGSHLHATHGLFEIFYKRSSILRQVKVLRDRAMDILRFVGLDKETGQNAVSLPHGGQRLLCLAVALAADPRLLLLDEPFTGMNVEEVTNIISLVKALRDERGITTIVVEHNMTAVLDLCDRAVVLNYGKKMTEGTPREVVEEPAVIEAYLGVDDAL